MSATPKCSTCGYYHLESHGCFPTNLVEPTPDLVTLLRELDQAALDTRTPESDAEWLRARGVNDSNQIPYHFTDIPRQTWKDFYGKPSTNT